jgi:hypothetical protein
MFTSVARTAHSSGGLELSDALRPGSLVKRFHRQRVRVLVESLHRLTVDDGAISVNGFVND